MDWVKLQNEMVLDLKMEFTRPTKPVVHLRHYKLLGRRRANKSAYRQLDLDQTYPIVINALLLFKTNSQREVQKENTVSTNASLMKRALYASQRMKSKASCTSPLQVSFRAASRIPIATRMLRARTEGWN
jgi:hypothetical protein